MTSLIISKIGPYGQELICHFGIQLAKNAQLSLSGSDIKVHSEKYRVCLFQENAHTFQKYQKIRKFQEKYQIVAISKQKVRITTK